MRLSFFTFLTLLLVATGCKVGPNYQPPESTCLPEVFAEDRAEDTCVSDESLVSWWGIFNDPLLDQLLEETVCGSFDYLIALENVRQAREQYWIQFTKRLPELDAEGQASRYHISHSLAPSSQGSLYQNLYQVGLDVLWEIDFFGKFKRSADASYDLWEAIAADAHAVKITVLSEVALTYMNICALQKNIDIQSQLIGMDHELFKMAKMRFEAGLNTKQEVETFNATQQLDQAALVTLKTALRQNIYSLAILLGRTPEEVIEDFRVIRPIPIATNAVASAGIPADLLRRRPDIMAAERRLAAATEHIGVAVADLFPSVSLIGATGNSTFSQTPGASFGYASNKIDNLFSSSNQAWGIGGFINWPVFDFGSRSAAVKVRESIAEQAYLNYQKTVISALAEAESALVAYFNEKERFTSLNGQVDANLKNLKLTENLYQNGLTDYSHLLQSKLIWAASQNALTDSEMNLNTNLIHLYKAMGGDW